MKKLGIKSLFRVDGQREGVQRIYLSPTGSAGSVHGSSVDLLVAADRMDGTQAEVISPLPGAAGSLTFGLTFAEPTVIDAIHWSNIDDQTRFPLHHRARSLTIESHDSTVPLVVELADAPGTQRIG